mmetsp:Transcript_3728/g.4979  ORF Transcript_3728/g.4979 Transcript_3728/m.4979 type:complete len:520 (-) Transcript_3728:785-2344(-)
MDDSSAVDVILVHAAESSHANDFVALFEEALSGHLTTLFLGNEYRQRDGTVVKAPKALAKFIIVFITRALSDKLKQHRNESKKLKTLFLKLGKVDMVGIVIPVVLESTMVNENAWSGSLMKLKGLPKLDMSTDELRQKNFDILYNMVVLPKQENLMSNEIMTLGNLIESFEGGNSSLSDVLLFMDENLESEEVQWKACQWLSTLEPARKSDVLAMHAQLRLDLTTNQGTRRVIRAMDCFPKSAQVQTYACKLLSHLARYRPNRQRIMKTDFDGARKILETMRTHANVETVQQEACGALRQLANYEPNLLLLQQMRPEKSIIFALSRFAESEYVQVNGCGAIKNFSVNNDMRTEFIRLGAGPIVVRTMKNFRSTESVQEQACGALKNLAKNTECILQLINLNAGDMIIQAMKMFPHNVSLQRKGCGALKNLCRNEEACNVIVRLDGASTLVKAMWNHKGNKRIQAKSCEALHRCAQTRTNRFTLKNIGAHIAIEEALAAFPTSLHIQKYGLSTKRWIVNS